MDHRHGLVSLYRQKPSLHVPDKHSQLLAQRCPAKTWQTNGDEQVVWVALVPLLKHEIQSVPAGQSFDDSHDALDSS